MAAVEDCFRFSADRGDAQMRLDQILVRRVTVVRYLSRNVAQRWIAAGAVTIDGQLARRPSGSVREGAAICVVLPPEAVRRVIPGAEPAPLDILFEDEALIAINKPAGMVVHPSYKRSSGTLLNALLWHMRDRADIRPGILTRLDKDTSGIVIVACAEGAHAVMQRDAARGLVRKHYLAIVDAVPQPPAGVICDALGRDPLDRRRVVVAPDGAPSETGYRVLSSTGRSSLLCCELVTGRTHQIRVHLGAQGWPVAGDEMYGGGTDKIARQALHAWRVTLPHPIGRHEIAIEAPLPDDMMGLLATQQLDYPA